MISLGDCSVEDIYKVLLSANPDYPTQYSKKHSVRKKKIKRFTPSQNAKLELPAISFQLPISNEVKEPDPELEPESKKRSNV